jgi:hypothetical protein
MYLRHINVIGDNETITSGTVEFINEEHFNSWWHSLSSAVFNNDPIRINYTDDRTIFIRPDRFSVLRFHHYVELSEADKPKQRS